MRKRYMHTYGHRKALELLGEFEYNIDSVMKATVTIMLK